MTRLRGVAVGMALAAAPVLSAPLGRFASPFALLLVLPPLAVGLEAFGLRDLLADQVRRVRTPVGRLVTTYVLGLGMSATLSLDAAAVAVTSVGVAVADTPTERRWQVGGAILASNVGSLLLPFSNLTNLVVVAATGLSLTAYVGAALAPQLAAAIAVGIVLVWRARSTLRDDPATPEDVPARAPMTAAPAVLAGMIGLAGALGAIAVGVAGGDMAVPFALAAAAVAGAAVATGRVTSRALSAAIPRGGLAVVAIASVLAAVVPGAASVVPSPQGPMGPFLALAVGAAIALVANNLPAAAFGALWLPGADATTIVAYLIGTNIAALATPHGSVATLIARDTGARLGVRTTHAAYLRHAWRYALGGSAAAFAAVNLLSRLVPLR